ncbi:MAG: thioredoxin fold domain-containing protein [Alphaproteobacteria bacterium]|nr:thioredoxin fold domain-containing protein [Alphaproteobacteria bacterium]
MKYHYCKRLLTISAAGFALYIGGVSAGAVAGGMSADPISSTTAQASSSTVAGHPDWPPLPAPLETMVAQGAQIRYLGRQFALDGWVTIKDGQEQYFYVTADGQALLMGILFNNKGDVVTLQQINALRDKEGPALDRLAGYAAPPPQEKYQEQAAAAQNSANMTGGTTGSNPQDILKNAAKSKAEQFYMAAESANWVEIGQKSAPLVYMFMDTECVHCHDFLNDFRKSGYLDKGMVRLRLIPVGVINEKSAPEAAMLLASPDPQKALYDHLDGNPAALSATAQTNIQGVDRNLAILQDWKIDSTPLSVYKDMNGKIKILQGRPKDVKNLVAELR